MAEHRFTFNDQEADLLAEVISHSLRGIPMRFIPENRAYLINLKSALERRVPGRRPTAAFVEDTEITRLGNKEMPTYCPVCHRTNGEHDDWCPNKS